MPTPSSRPRLAARDLAQEGEAGAVAPVAAPSPAATRTSLPELDFDRYKPEPGWYAGDPSGLHGVAHAARVLVWADAIGEWMLARGTPVDLDVVRWAAVLHDIRRENEGEDPGHGRRAARWLATDPPARLQGLNETQVRLLQHCCRWHVPPDEAAPTMPDELVCLKDADSLDRVRLGDFDPRFLRTACARRLIGSARDLFHASEADQRGDGWQAVSHAAARVLWRVDDEDGTARRTCLACHETVQRHDQQARPPKAVTGGQ